MSILAVSISLLLADNYILCTYLLVELVSEHSLHFLMVHPCWHQLGEH